jgi:hypothetical protein
MDEKQYMGKSQRRYKRHPHTLKIREGHTSSPERRSGYEIHEVSTTEAPNARIGTPMVSVGKQTVAGLM